MVVPPLAWTNDPSMKIWPPTAVICRRSRRGHLPAVTPRSSAGGHAAALGTIPGMSKDERSTPDPRFAWHPEPELIGIRDPAASRGALEQLGREAWATALDYVYDEAFRRAMGEPAEYDALRRAFFGTRPDGHTSGPAPAPANPTRSEVLLAEFRDRLAPHQLNA